MLGDDFPVLDAYTRWAKVQHEGAQKTEDELVAIALRRYAESPTLLEALVRESLRYLAIEAIHGRAARVVPPGRPAGRTEEMVAAAETMSARRRAEIIDRIRNAKDANDNPVARFFERHPIEGVDVPILSMTREELLVAAQHRDVESLQAKRRAMLCREIAERLAPGQVAGEILDEVQLADIATRVVRRSNEQAGIQRGEVSARVPSPHLVK